MGPIWSVLRCMRCIHKPYKVIALSSDSKCIKKDNWCFCQLRFSIVLFDLEIIIIY